MSISMTNSLHPDPKLCNEPKITAGHRYDPDKRWLVRRCDGDRGQGLIPASILQPVFEEMTKDEAFAKRKLVIDELIETETDFVNDIKFVVDNYLRPALIKFVPKIIKENFQIIFGNLKDILEFHTSVLLEAVQYYANEPNLLGRAFIRLEREFDKHVRYCRDEPIAQQFLSSVPEVSAFFETLRQRISDDKSLADHLKLPLQRINDYQLLFRELIRYTNLLNEDTHDLQRAFELMINVPNRAEDNKFLANIEGYRGSLYKLGHLLTHDWFSVTYADCGTKERYLFLFKSLILVTKVKRISDNRSVFQFKDSIKLQDIQFRDRDNDFEFELIKEDSKEYPIVLVSHRDQTKSQWVSEIKKFASEVDENVNMSRNYNFSTSTNRSHYTNRSSLGEVTESSSKQYSTYNNRTKTVSSSYGDELVREISGATTSGSALSDLPSNVSRKRSSSSTIEVDRKKLANIQDEAETMESKSDTVKSYQSDSKTDVNYNISPSSSSSNDDSTSGKTIRRKLLKPCHITPGDKATFEISVGEKYTNITWLKDNKKFDKNLAERTTENHSPDTLTYELEIRDCIGSDTGIYTAVATNENNEKSFSTTQLIVSDKDEMEIDDKSPIFLIQLKDTELLEGTHLCCMVKVKGEPMPDVTFYKDNKKISDNDVNVRVIKDNANIGSYELYIETVKYSDAGLYKCIAQNSHGTRSCRATVTVTDHKDIFGEVAESDALSSGLKPSFTWKRDGNEFEPDERFKVLMGNDDDSLALIFQHVKPDDAGLYTCVAQTTNGRISCSAELTIQGAVHELHKEPERPKLQYVTARNEVIAGGMAVLEMKVKGYPQPQVKWTHDGELIEPSGKYKFLYEDNESMSLMIKNVEVEDSGTYEVSATNDLGTDETKMSLIVKSGPKILTDISDKKGLVGDPLEIAIEIDGTPKPDVIFYKDGQPLLENTALKIVNENNIYKLIFNKLSISDSGSYSVVATNEISQASKLWKIDVESKPTVIEPLDDLYECSIGDEVEFRFKIEAHPKPEVKWFKNGEELHDEHYKISDDGNVYLMRITGSVETDSANYKVKVINIHGSTSIDTKLNVRGAPKILKNLQDITANEHDKNVELNVEIESYPKSKVKWYLDEMEISESRCEFTRIESDNGSKLVIKEVTSELSGQYCCKVINELGATETSAKLFVNCKPKFLKHLNNTTVEEGTTLNLAVEVAATPEPVVKWLKNGKEVNTDARIRILRDNKRCETYNLSVDLVKYEDGGDYEVIVQNSLGTITSKSTVIVQKLQMCDTTEETDKTDTNANKTRHTARLKAEAVEDKDDEINLSDSREELQEREEELVPVEQKVFEIEEKPGEIDEDLNADGSEIVNTNSGTNNSSNMASNQTDVLDSELKQSEEICAEPIILESNISDGKIVEASEIVYKVKVTGSPTPTVTWIANNEVLQNDSRCTITQNGNEYKMVVKKARLDDAGCYQCKITNNKGEVVQKAVLTVLPEAAVKKPQIVENLCDRTISNGDDLVLKLVLTSDSTPNLKWYRNGEQLTINKTAVKMNFKDLDNHVKEFTYTFDIFNCDLSNAGDYKVIASNKFGECSSQCKIQVLSKPTIEGAKNITTDVETNAEIAVEIAGNPIADTVWFHKGVLIENGAKYEILNEHPVQKLIIKNVDLDDIGDYAVVATNSEGQVEHKCCLDTKCEKPKFLKELNNSSVDDGDSVKLRVRCEGVPLPSVEWLINGSNIDEKNTNMIINTSINENFVVSELEIPEFGAEFVGNVTCLAKNAGGQVDTTCHLVINQIPPTILRRLERHVDTAEGQPLELVAKVTGSPKPELKWFKNDEEMFDDNNIEKLDLPDGVVKLSFKHVSPLDSGTYKLVVSNPSGQASGISIVTVNCAEQKPEFLKELNDLSTVVGEPMELEAVIKGTPSPDVKWVKDGELVKESANIHTESQNDGTVRLKIDYLKPEDAGIYNLIVSNNLGESIQSAKVSIQNKPKKPDFLEDLPSLVKVVEGFPIKLSVQAVGYPQPSIQWLRNGEEIDLKSENVKIIDSPDDASSTLLIKDCKLPDAGTYQVVAENASGKTAQKTDLQISPKSNEKATQECPMFLSDLRNITIDEGSQLKLEATISGNPLSAITWFKNDDILNDKDDNGGVLKTCDGRKVSLTVDKAGVSDSGRYTCELQNGAGSAKSECSVQVTKNSSVPVFIEKFTDIQQVANRDAILGAKVFGNPTPEIFWFKDDEPIGDSAKYYVKRDGPVCQLQIRNCDDDDRGVYKCVAQNNQGKAQCSGLLRIVDKIKSEPKTEPATFLKRISDVDLYPGMTANFTACASGIPEPSVQWFHNDKPLFNSGRFRIESDKGGLLRLTVSDTSDVDLGKYSCTVTNDYGHDVCTATLCFDSFNNRPKKHSIVDTTKPYRPRIPGAPLPLTESPYVSRMTDRNLTLSWRPLTPYTYHEPVTYNLEMCELPGDDWTPVWSNIRSCTCGVRDLKPNSDYKFRVRVQNKYGVSEPSPYVMTHRNKLVPDFVPRRQQLEPGDEFNPKSSYYFPPSFDLDRPSLSGMKQAPIFLRQEYDNQYGVKNQNSNLCWFVYGYPKPTVTYYFNGDLIESGGRFDYSYTRNGQATLFVNKMLERDAGYYEAVARNEHGEARQTVRLEMAEHPYFIRKPDVQCGLVRGSARFEARISGKPYPEIRWYKDWKMLSSTSRIKIDFIEPDTTVLTIRDVILKDEGLYSVSGRNVAGSVSYSVMLYVEEKEYDYEYRTYTNIKPIQVNRKLFTDFYDIGDELGRGTQGVTYHVVDKSTGHDYAAKIMYGRDEFRRYMHNEMDAMNNLHHRKLIRLHDIYENDDSLILVTELAGGGQLVRDYLITRDYYYESEISGYIRQILLGLDYMHSSGFAHLGLNIGDILLSHVGGHDIKLTDFGLTRRVLTDNLQNLRFGMPDYVSPEISNGERVSYSSDMWSVGIITYILISGTSPFLGRDDRETLTKIRDGKWSFDDYFWRNISGEGKDFISKLLMYHPGDRIDVKMALRHPWIDRITTTTRTDYRISSEYLRKYYSDYYYGWYDNASCKTWYRRRRLSGAFQHPSHMVYPPFEVHTPTDFGGTVIGGHRVRPDRNKKQVGVDDSHPDYPPLGYDIGVIKSESHYQNGPDTYLLQLRDVDFPVRLREYMKVAASRRPGIGYVLSDTNSYDWSLPSIRERRRFTDVMDEEIDDERKERIKLYGSDEIYSLRRLRHELGTRLDTYVEAEAMIESRQSGLAPFFRERPQTTVIIENQDVQLSCLAVGDPTPIVQWFKNDTILVDTSRISIESDSDGRSLLKLRPANIYDVGLYKIVARNKIGQTVARARIVLGSVPDPPQTPKIAQVSDCEILLTWNQPKDFGHSPVLCYKLQYKQAFRNDWIDLAHNIDHEFYLVRNLDAEKSYVFRLATKNQIGWSRFGAPTLAVETKPIGCDAVKLSHTMLSLQDLTDSGQEIFIDPLSKPNYNLENDLMQWSTENDHFMEQYNFISEIYRGEFSTVVKGLKQYTNDFVVAKISELCLEVENEFNLLRTLRHEKIVTLFEAYKNDSIAVLIQEKLQGADILTYLSTRHEYSEQIVANIVLQIIDALQYMHWRGYCHLNLQPDNVVMCSVRSAQIKLVDMGCAQKVSKLGTIIPQIVGHPDFTSPEVLFGDQVFPQTDIWSLGVLTYLMLSGSVPFEADDDDERKQNIMYVRYRFENLYKDISQESVRFLMSTFKRNPCKRPTSEECYENRWLQPTDFMIRKREKAVFPGENLKV